MRNEPRVLRRHPLTYRTMKQTECVVAAVQSYSSVWADREDQDARNEAEFKGLSIFRDLRSMMVASMQLEQDKVQMATRQEIQVVGKNVKAMWARMEAMHMEMTHRPQDLARIDHDLRDHDLLDHDLPEDLD